MGILEKDSAAADILNFAIKYRTTRKYPSGLTSNKMCAVRKMAVAITVDHGEVFLEKE